MAFRSVRISNPSALSVKNRQLVVEQAGEKITIPLEDIATITLEDPSIRLSVHVLREASVRNIVVIVCDEKHMPSGLLTPYANHSRQLQVIRMQWEMPRPFQKRIWQRIIRQKIENQARCCALSGDMQTADELREIIGSVGSGDPTNREAVAARIHFRAVFDFTLRRRDPIDKRNGVLNYGYAVLRAALARAVAEYGFIPAIGINHESELNSFNLIDDFLEPYRPLVDLFLAQWLLHHDISDGLTPSLKSELTGLLHSTILIQKEECSVMHAMDVMLKSFVTACRALDPALLVLPQLIPIQRHRYE